MDIVTVTILTAALFSAPPSDAPTGSLKIEHKKPKAKSTFEVVSYTPHEGDLIFYNDWNVAWLALFAYAGTGPPLHMGIVVRKQDGKLAVLEAGPDDTVWVKLLNIDRRLQQFDRDFKGTIHVRRCKKMVSAEESKALTKFAHAQDGKRYAIGRLLLQGTSLRSRGPVRELFLGRTVLDRDSWICSELAVAAGTVVKLFDPKVVHANVAYPRDLLDDVRYDLSATYHPAAVWQPAAIPR